MSNRKKNKQINFYWIYLIFIFCLIGLQVFSSFTGKYQTIDETKFFKYLNDGDIEKIQIINREFAEVYIKKNRITNSTHRDKKLNQLGPHYKFEILDIKSFRENIINHNNTNTENVITWTAEKRNTNWTSDLLSWLIPIGIMVLIWVFIMRRMSSGGAGGQIFNIGKSKAQLFDKDKMQTVTFNDVAGLEGAKEEVEEIVSFLKSPKKYTSLGGKIPKGVLLVGPPGTGKTLLAKAVAGEAKVPFFSLSGSDFVEMFVGVGASRVRDLFKMAKSKSPSIVFIDEIDAIGRARGKSQMTGANDERENTLNQLLTEMDGFGTNHHVIVVAATNRADILDRALTRAGRFDRQIYIDLPELEERKDIFKVHTKKIKIDKKIDLDFLAKQTPGFSGADIANICNEAALNAAKNNKKKIEREDFLEAIDRIVGGLEKKNKLVSKEERETVAYHEAGHATVSWMLEHAAPLIKVTIVPRGRSLGAAWYLPEERQLTTKEQIFDEMCVAMGGRAAEELIFKKVTTGALSDLEKITKQARAMIAFFGLNDKIGNVTYYDSSGQESPFTKPYSEYTAKLIDEEIKKITNEAYNRAKNILTKHKKSLIKLSELLLEKEVIFKKDVENILGKRKWKEVERIRVNKIKKK
ncbi:MAG: ATP-dependent zinc metalloprotease FtsH [Bacteroidota bacterium]|nr:ATP-dependent zinc metalloprotease FtsH [Bacteroidota bacterium]